MPEHGRRLEYADAEDCAGKTSPYWHKGKDCNGYLKRSDLRGAGRRLQMHTVNDRLDCDSSRDRRSRSDANEIRNRARRWFSANVAGWIKNA